MIKPEADSTYFSKHTTQREVARQLDEAFDINFGASHGQLAFWLAQPKQHAKERFGLSQEVLVIYSAHARTDARVLTAIENITRIPEFKNRVDRVLFLLIHAGDQKEVEDLVRRQTDRIVVPFHVLELRNPARGSVFVRSKIAAAIGALDLFGMSSPITSDRYFFGRDELVQKLIIRSAQSKENSGLFGLRKTGKTSVLYAIQRRLSDANVAVEYIDCHNPGVHGARWWQVLRQIVLRLAGPLSVEQTRELGAKDGYRIESSGAEFLGDVKAIIKMRGISHIVLMLDEVEFITHTISGALGRHWDQDAVPFWQTIRSVHQETKGQLTFIVAGVNPASAEKSHFGVTPNPIFQLAAAHYLEPLSAANARAMVRTIGRYAGLDFEENVHQYLQQTYGGHPYLIRLACSEIWLTSDITNPNSLNSVRIADFEKLRPRIQARLAQPIKDILLSLIWWYPDDYDVLRILATGDKDFVAEYLREQPESTIQFAKWGLLRADTGEFAIADVREFLTRYGEQYKNELSPFTRTDLPPELLPEMPDLVTLGKLFRKRCELETKLRRIVLLYFGVRYAWNPNKIAQAILKGIRKRQDRSNPAELFVGRTPQEVVNDVYLLDLKSIITENWDVFGSLFDENKPRFEMNMEAVNKARRVDAHTKPVSPQEAEEFENSYGWINVRLSRVSEPEKG